MSFGGQSALRKVGATEPTFENQTMLIDAECLERFWAKVNLDGPVLKPELGPCHVWTAGLNDAGYGIFNLNGSTKLAPRIAWLLKYGEWPTNSALHLCDNRPCVRWDHLYNGIYRKSDDCIEKDSRAWLENFGTRVNREGPIHPKLGTRCWLWTGALDEYGYGLLRVNRKLWRTHRISWCLSRGELNRKGLRVIPEDRQIYILHKCDVTTCCRPSHLFAGTAQDNADDRDNKGRHVVLSGSVHGMALLNEDSVLKIRSRYNSGETDIYVLADQYGVSYACIHNLLSRKTWKHV